MQKIIERAIQLKKTLVDFVYDAEGEVAVALETYAVEKSHTSSYGIKQQNLTIDLFLTEGKIKNKTPLHIFLEQAKNLNSKDIELVKLWQNNFIGLFEIKEIQENSYQLMNWLTAKTYKVYRSSEIPDKEINRWQLGEIILAIIAPINNLEWIFFSDRIIKGKLSQPKLAVAIGEFRDNYPEFLYADAPELLEQAWESVAVYHQEFVDYLKSDLEEIHEAVRLTLPGYKLNQKIGELQKIMNKKRLAEAGIDDSKSLSEMLAESGASEAEFTEAASDLGADTEAVANIIKNKNKLSMVTPKVDLPPEIKQAESVTVFSHPRWGQMFLPNFEKFTDLLTSESPESQENSNLLVRKYLEQPEANYYVWQQIKQEYPQALEQLLPNYCHKNDFNLETDLDKLLLEHNKPSTPQLPSIASVPIHLNNLFEAAVAQVQKTKSKTKKKKKKKGFL
ncbi:conserved hypothetical protein [Hyella patelloides LEGE 07179]|uniref:Uncharacterized protein n=1 Tax=Hyella patelloides LEGE 07179 TaxID=945734 RepID=A0A563VQZ9_9CYAN|nr:hypothetical protein [Hyella patelloides]VEP13834.1 conserved hypothetical protein [Hyella patelloides LEGE 07179]